QNRRDLPKDTYIDRLEVLRYVTRKRSKVRMGTMSIETELTLEQTQQVTIEILLEPTFNKLLVGDMGDFIWIELVTLDINLGPEGKLKSKIKILDHKHAEGTAKNSQDNKVLRHEVKTYAMPIPYGEIVRPSFM
nr:hypothetical protein [Tanacetum cinerariifolium]